MQRAYLEQLLNGLIYELFFPDELHAANIRLFDLLKDTGIPEMGEISEQTRASRLQDFFGAIHDTNHPIRGALFALRSLEPVRIIEGEK
jgi:hypothetical protein